MPKSGFKSITVSETVYDQLKKTYHKNKEKLKLRGITSFSGYITFSLFETAEKEEISITW